MNAVFTKGRAVVAAAAAGLLAMANTGVMHAQTVSTPVIDSTMLADGKTAITANIGVYWPWALGVAFLILGYNFVGRIVGRSASRGKPSLKV